MCKLILFRMVLAMWLSLATTYALEAELSCKDDKAGKASAGTKSQEKEPISELPLSGYACNPSSDYFPGEAINLLGSLSNNQPKFDDFTPYWQDYP